MPTIPIGPLALADLVGLSIVCLAIMEVLYEEFGDSKYRPHPLLRKMVRGGLLWKKKLKKDSLLNINIKAFRKLEAFFFIPHYKIPLIRLKYIGYLILKGGYYEEISSSGFSSYCLYLLYCHMAIGSYSHILKREI